MQRLLTFFMVLYRAGGSTSLLRLFLELQDDHGNVLHHGNMERAVKVLERMENQNTYKELAMDFKVCILAHAMMLSAPVLKSAKRPAVCVCFTLA